MFCRVCISSTCSGVLVFIVEIMSVAISSLILYINLHAYNDPRDSNPIPAEKSMNLRLERGAADL